MSDEQLKRELRAGLIALGYIGEDEELPDPPAFGHDHTFKFRSILRRLLRYFFLIKDHIIIDARLAAGLRGAQ
jgi:hypothetical protein